MTMTEIRQGQRRLCHIHLMVCLLISKHLAGDSMSVGYPRMVRAINLKEELSKTTAMLSIVTD